MAINVRTKGAEGERQVIKLLTPIVVDVMVALAFPPEQIETARKMIQRNQNQSAVGGCDLSNVFGLSIEVKRQETLSIPAWWRQTVTAAERNNELPVLIYRQNNKPWRIRTYGFLHTPSNGGGWTSVQAVIEIDEAAFLTWFREWVKGKLNNGYEIRA